MEEKTKKLSLQTILILSLAGIIISAYLVQNHYAPPEAGSLCDFTDTISCSLVNTSEYSEVFGVPLALLGALWFFFLGWMTWKALQHDHYMPKLMFYWAIIGIGSVMYTIVAEILLQALCPLCTVLHLFIIIIALFSYRVMKAQSELHTKTFHKTARAWLFGTAFLYGLVFLIFAFSTPEVGDYDQFAQCISEKGITMYGSFRCGFCTRQKQDFGSSFRFIHDVECHPQGPDSQWQLCEQKKIEGTPAWIMEDENGVELKRNSGYMTIAQLEEFSGCAVNSS